MTLYEARLFFIGALLILELLLLFKVEFMLLDELFPNFGKKGDRAPYGSCEDCQTPCKDCKIEERRQRN